MTGIFRVQKTQAHLRQYYRGSIQVTSKYNTHLRRSLSDHDSVLPGGHAFHFCHLLFGFLFKLVWQHLPGSVCSPRVRIDPPERLFLQREAQLLGIVRVAVQLTDGRGNPVSYFAESS